MLGKHVAVPVSETVFLLRTDRSNEQVLLWGQGFAPAMCCTKFNWFEFVRPGQKWALFSISHRARFEPISALCAHATRPGNMSLSVCPPTNLLNDNSVNFDFCQVDSRFLIWVPMQCFQIPSVTSIKYNRVTQSSYLYQTPLTLQRTVLVKIQFRFVFGERKMKLWGSQLPSLYLTTLKRVHLYLLLWIIFLSFWCWKDLKLKEKNHFGHLRRLIANIPDLKLY